MRASSTLAIFFASGLAATFACGKAAEEPPAPTDAGTVETFPDAALPDALPVDAGPVIVDAGSYSLAVLPPSPTSSCSPHAAQAPQFVDNTGAWGLVGVDMSSFYAADLDLDGYPDLIVLSGAQNERERIPTQDEEGFHNMPDGSFHRDVGVLMNRPNPGGGRRFVDETAESKLFEVRGGSTLEYRMTQIAAVADVNNDGFPDVYAGVVLDATNTDQTSTFNQDRSEILLNDGHGHFSLAPRSDLSRMMEPQNYQAVFTDVDNDGRIDLFLTYWYSSPGRTEFGSQAQLFLGNGDGTFSSVTDEVGLTTDPPRTSALLAGTNARPSFGAMACDLDGDGYPELMISSYGGQSNMLYANNGSGRFTRRIERGGFDGDLDTNYSTNQYYACYCSVHRGDAYCADARPPMVVCPSPADAYWRPGLDDSPALLNGNNFSAACRDMNGDGKPDIFQGTIRHWWAGNSTDPPQLMLNQTSTAGISLRRVPPSASGIVFPHLDPNGWNEGIQQATLVDLNNDGFPDVLTGGSDYAYQYGHVFEQQPDGTYVDRAQAWGLNFPCVDGLAVADFDRDGDLDVVVRASLFRDCAAPGWASIGGVDPGFSGYHTTEMHLFTNDAPAQGRWIALRLVGDGSANTMGIGARVRLTAGGLTQTQEVLGAHGIGSESDDPGVLFFGLGDCGEVASLEVRWPNRDQTTETWHDIPAGGMIELHQGDSRVFGVILR
ncbi:MAG: CRTAC1 family protein [Myxococcota bacterium]